MALRENAFTRQFETLAIPASGPPAAHAHVPDDIDPQGAASTLDADFLDGITSAGFALASHAHSWTVSTITASATLTTSQTVVLCDATSGAITATLPAAAGNTGKRYFIKKTDSSANAVTVDGNGAETIDDTATQVLASQYDSIEIVSDGTEWWII